MSELMIDIEELLENTAMNPYEIADFLNIPSYMVCGAIKSIEEVSL